VIGGIIGAENAAVLIGIIEGLFLDASGLCILFDAYRQGIRLAWMQ
jgi:hypothetical protein